jgi:RNA polymerase sigma factor (sigma-70 family)
MGLALYANSTQPSVTEQQLAAAVRNGDDAAFEELFSRYRSRISAYVLSAVGDHGRAEDITQEVFISALRRLRDTERPISFKPWIYAIAKNACIDEFRRTWRVSEVSLEQDGAAGSLEQQLPSTQPTPDMVAENRQQLYDLRGAFRGLSENHHRILVMRELEGLSYGEIGKRMGMSRPMVESTLFRARKRLNQEFKELESGRRCEHVRAAIDRPQVCSLQALGARERRQVAKHLSHCQTCRQHAWMAGFDASALKPRRPAERIAALLPLGWWRLRRGGGSAVPDGSRVHSLTAGRIPGLARYSDSVAQLPLGRAAAAAAAVAFAAAGGGYVVSGTGQNPAPRVAPPHVAAAAPAVAAPPVINAVHRAAAGQSLSPRGRASGVVRGGHHRGANAQRAVARASAHRGPGASYPTTAQGTVGTPAPAQPVPGNPVGGGAQGAIGGTLGGVVSPPPSSTTQKLATPPVLPGVRAPSVQAPSQAGPVNVPAAVQGAAQTAGQAVNSAGQTAGQAVNSAGHTTGQVVDSAGHTAGQVVSGAKSTLAGLGG